MNHNVNLFLVGAAKSGTTTLYKLLGQHPDIFIGEKKEPHYFARDLFKPSKTYQKKICLTWDAYLRNYYDHKKEKYLLDASVYYMYFEEVAQRIYTYNPDAKIIMICREPVARFYSHYKMLRKEGITTQPLLEFMRTPFDNNGLDVLKMGHYQEAVDRFTSIFGDNFLLLNFVELKDLDSLLIKLTNFLDIESNFPFIQEHENQSGIPRSEFLSYIHMKFPLTVFLKKIMPKGKFRSILGETILKSFYVQPTLNQTEMKTLVEYYEKHL
jgi:hypothetical protein